MSEPYKNKQILDHWKIAPTKQVVGQIIALTGLRLTNRATWVIHPRTRACPKNCIVEVTLTDETDIQPGTKINSVMYLGFLEMLQGGLVVIGQPVKVKGTLVGEVSGFSEIHYPNHLNIIISVTAEFAAENILPYSDADRANLKYKIGDELVFEAMQ